MPESSRIRRILAGVSMLLFALHGALGMRVLWQQLRLLALGQGDDLMSGAELDALVASVSELLRLYNYGVAITALPFLGLFALSYARWASHPSTFRILGAWFIPIVNLYLPYRLVQDIEEGRAQRRDGWIPFLWWTTWIASWGASVAASLLAGQGRVLDAARWDAAWAGLVAASAVLGIVLTLRWARR